MVGSRMAQIAAMAVAPLLTSCGRGDGPALYPVTGQVVYKGQPAVGANVSFLMDGDTPKGPNDAPLVPSGLVDSEGKFTVQTDELGYGAPAGKYKVLIQWRSRDDDPSAAAPSKKGGRKVVTDKPDGVPDKLNGRYMNAEKSGLRADIKPEKNELPAFDVSK